MPPKGDPADLDRLRERLEGIGEELADLAIDRLRAAVEGDAGRRPRNGA